MSSTLRKFHIFNVSHAIADILFRANGARTIQQYTAAAQDAPQNIEPEAVQGGEVAAAGSTPTGTGSGTSPTQTRGSAGVSSLASLSIPVLGLAAALAALMSA